ncbi:MAG: hypothetical protein NVSMB48_13110 [Marmoricola sp.]
MTAIPVEPALRGAAEFARQLSVLGIANVSVNGTWVFFDLQIPIGAYAGTVRRIAADVPVDFPDTPPPGPHINPPTLHPAGAVLGSSLGADWVYWSRPAQGWAADRSVRAWLRHVRSLFAQIINA